MSSGYEWDAKELRAEFEDMAQNGRDMHRVITCGDLRGWEKDLEALGVDRRTIYIFCLFPTWDTAWARSTQGPYMLQVLGYVAGEPGGEGRKKLLRCLEADAKRAVQQMSNKWCAGARQKCVSAIDCLFRWAHDAASLEDLKAARIDYYAANWTGHTYKGVHFTRCCVFPAQEKMYQELSRLFSIATEPDRAQLAKWLLYLGIRIYRQDPEATEEPWLRCANTVRAFYPTFNTSAPPQHSGRNP